MTKCYDIPSLEEFLQDTDSDAAIECCDCGTKEDLVIDLNRYGRNKPGVLCQTCFISENAPAEPVLTFVEGDLSLVITVSEDFYYTYVEPLTKILHTTPPLNRGRDEV